MLSITLHPRSYLKLPNNLNDETIIEHSHLIGGVQSDIEYIKQTLEESKKDRQLLHTKIDLMLMEVSVTKTIIKVFKLIGAFIVALLFLKIGDATGALKELLKLLF